MHILVINCGSSSVKMAVITADQGRRLLEAKIDGLANGQPLLIIGDQPPIPLSTQDFAAALGAAFTNVRNALGDVPLAGIGHRVVHGGETYGRPVRIDAQVEADIDALRPLAPLHNPVNLQGIQEAKKVWPDLPHIAVFDTAFHATLPRRARPYALPKALAEKHGLRRYGFHGTSHSYVARKAAAHLGFSHRELRIISCHLGNGASICAVEYGRSVETSMGMTPLEGLVMGTRSGDIDPGALLYLMRAENMSVDEVDTLLNKESGLKGLAGDHDMRTIEQMAAQGNEDARQAIQVFAHRVRKYIGAYAALMGGVDAIVFTGGIGENSAAIRERAAQRLEFLGAILNEDANRDADMDGPSAIAEISMRHSRCKLLVVPTDEQWEIARQSAGLVAELDRVASGPLEIPIAVSARHVHLTQEAVEALFGEGHALQLHKWLSQPGQFAAKEQVTLLGPKNRLERVRVLGPVRSKNQVEISRTDEFFLGIDAPVRASGHIENTPGITLEGPAGTLTIPDGVICAWRHIHATPEDAAHLGVEDKDVVEVRVQSADRSLVFGDVLVRVSPKYKLEMHIDTDEGNAAELGRGATGSLTNTEGQALITRKKLR